MRKVLITAVFAVCLWLVPAARVSQCPYQCICGHKQMIKGKTSPNRADCNIIPSDLPFSIVMLKVYDTRIANITQDMISGVISQLVNVKLESLHIEYIEDGAFQNAIKLKILTLSKNKLKVITANTFASCTTIVELYLQDNELEYIDNKAFATLVNLRELYIQRNKLTHIPSSLSPNLVTLDLSANKIGPNVTRILNQTHLTLLDLCDNPMQHISLETLASLSSLEHLCLGGDGIGLPQSAAKHLSKLEDLSLTTTTVTPLDDVTMHELAQLKSIKTIEIAYYYIPSFKFLDKITNVWKIQLTKITISSEAGDEFVDSLPKLKFLANIQIDRSPQLAKVFTENSHKFKIRNLHTLTLRHDALTSLHPTSIPNHNLPYLDISDNPFHCDCSLKWLQDAHELQNKQNTLCATPDEHYGRLVTAFIRDLNCTTEDMMPGEDEDTHSSSHHGEDETDNTATHIIIGCVIAALIITIIVLATIYILYKKKRCHKITPDTELHDQQQQQQQQVQTIRQAHSNDHLLKK